MSPVIRIESQVVRGDLVSLQVDGRRIDAYAGETLATALIAAGIRAFRRSPVAGTPRGVFCFIGVCQECVVNVDGRRVEACLEPARQGMVVTLDADAPLER